MENGSLDEKRYIVCMLRYLFHARRGIALSVLFWYILRVSLSITPVTLDAKRPSNVLVFEEKTTQLFVTRMPSLTFVSPMTISRQNFRHGKNNIWLTWPLFEREWYLWCIYVWIQDTTEGCVWVCLSVFAFSLDKSISDRLGHHLCCLIICMS